MRQRTTAPLHQEPPTYDTIWDKLRYLKSRAQRRANKLAGRPATPETGILASMVSDLVDSTQSTQGGKYVVVAAALSSPDLARFTSEEIGDILDYLRIRDLTSKPQSSSPLHATSAAYGAYGKGLCHTYTDSCVCEREEWMLPRQCVLHVDLNSNALSGTIKGMQTVYGGAVYSSFVKPLLGYNHRYELSAMLNRPHGDTGLYWSAVKNQIRRLLRDFHRNNTSEVTELLLTGRYAADENLKNALKALLLELSGPDGVLAIPSNYIMGSKDEAEAKAFFTFATARGAAEIAKRRQECVQEDQCGCRVEDAHRQKQAMFGKHLRYVMWMWLKSLVVFMFQ